MNRHVNAIAGRLSLRPPQRQSLEILDRITEIVPPKKGSDVAAALEAIRSEFPTVTDFERDFPSLCFALATGVGKTRLMGAFISYLHLAHGINNFFVLAPNLTIYNKLIADFTPNTPKYVFTGIAENNDLNHSISTAAGKVEKQVLRLKEKFSSKKRRRTATRAAAPIPGGSVEAAPPTPRIIQARRYRVKPMTPEEAASIVSESDAQFIVFRDAETNKVGVLYKRTDGNFGFIEP